jgi:hypothetical protein
MVPYLVGPLEHRQSSALTSSLPPVGCEVRADDLRAFPMARSVVAVRIK